MAGARRKLSIVTCLAILVLVIAIGLGVASFIWDSFNVSRAFLGDTLDVLQHADHFELIALYPYEDELDPLMSQKPTPVTIERHRVIGRVDIQDEAIRKEIIA